MNDLRLRRLTGIILILTPVAFNVFFTLLSMTFEYPDILREPTGYVLRHFDAGGGELGRHLVRVHAHRRAVRAARGLGAQGPARQDTPYMAVATTFGVVAGVVQFLGLVRWPFLVPYLADTYCDPALSGATRESVAVVFQAFNRVLVLGSLNLLRTTLHTSEPPVFPLLEPRRTQLARRDPCRAIFPGESVEVLV